VRLRLFTALVALDLVACRPAASGGKAVMSKLPLGAESILPVPASNPLACARVELGQRLFFDPRLSRGGETSCSSCHDPSRAFTDGRTVAIGDGGTVGTRNAPTLLGRAYGRSHFWDGRAATLEEQVLQPFTNTREFANSHEEIERRLREGRAYQRAFADAFQGRKPSVELAALALASFVRTLVTGDSPVDRFLLLGDSAALTGVARRGFELFRGKAGCIRCHEPPLFTDETFHNTGIAWRDSVYADSGRNAVTGRYDDIGAFKTPTLRNVTLTAPYTHDGSLPTLEAVVEFYDRGGNPNRHLDPMLRPLNLTGTERSDLVAFLRALTGVTTMPRGAGC
jgi:cytochrome c peroxidase